MALPPQKVTTAAAAGRSIASAITSILYLTVNSVTVLLGYCDTVGTWDQRKWSQ